MCVCGAVCVRGCVCAGLCVCGVRDGGVYVRVSHFFGGEPFFLAFFLAESYILLSESFFFGGVIYFLV